MNTNSLAQSSNFEFGCPDMNFGPKFVTKLTLPGIQVENPQTGIRGGAKGFFGASAVTYSSLKFDLLIDEMYKVYFEFYNTFMRNISPTSGKFDVKEFESYVQINDSKGYPIFKVNYHGCRLKSTGDIELVSGDDGEKITMSVEIDYDYFDIDILNPN